MPSFIEMVFQQRDSGSGGSAGGNPTGRTMAPRPWRLVPPAAGAAAGQDPSAQHRLLAAGSRDATGLPGMPARAGALAPLGAADGRGGVFARHSRVLEAGARGAGGRAPG